MAKTPTLYDYNGSEITMSWATENFKRSHQWFRYQMADGKTMQQVIDELMGKHETLEFMKIAMNAFPVGDTSCNFKLM